MFAASPAPTLRTRPRVRVRRLALALALASTPWVGACATTPDTLDQPQDPGPGNLTRQHDLLEGLVGDFEVAGWTQRDPFGVRLDFVGRASGRFILDGLIAELSIQGRLGDDDYAALYLVGYDAASGTYQAQALSSWEPTIGPPAEGTYDEASGVLALRHRGTRGVGGSSRGARTTFTFLGADTWTLDRYALEWEPRRWSNLRATRVDRVEAGPEPESPVEAAPIQAGSDATR